ncbi:MAG: carbamoyl-phosphate synthase small subunit [Myxococcota bacterium]|jgi:carbamoyl-phosphate synthase small subunit
MNISTSKNAALVFSNGEIIRGFGIGKPNNTTIGEICFNTAITGYQEILTDPSYSGQIINFTFPHIGNVGVNDDDIESQIPKVKGLIIRETITNSGNYRAKGHLNDWLIKYGITGICSVDTRQITKNIRDGGGKNVAIIFDENLQDIDFDKIIADLKQNEDLKGVELASSASLNKKYEWSSEGKWDQEENKYNQISDKKLKVVAIDYGAKLNILRCLTEAGIEVVVVPAQTSFEEILAHNPAGVFLSNGPGDPFETGKYAIPTIKQLVEKNIPTFGICLGHQLLSLAMGAKTSKMHQGHRGANHPVQDLKTKKVEITSQNHGFTVDEESLPDSLEITHRSLFDGTIEGIKVKNKPAFSVQYHPESSPGPSDSYYLFERFVAMM